MKSQSEIRKTRRYVDSLNNLSFNNSRKNPSYALKLSMDAYISSSNLEYLKGLSESCQIIAAINEDQGDYASALSYYMQSLKFNILQNDKKKISESLNSLGALYFDHKKYNEALKHFNQALILNDGLANKKEYALSLMRIANVYSQIGPQESALVYYKRALKIFYDISDTTGIASCQNNLGEFFRKQKSYEESKMYYDLSLENFINTGNKRGISENYNNLGELEFCQNQYKNAIKYFQKSLAIAIEISSAERIMRNYEGLSKTSARLKQYEEAYNYHLKYQKLKDSLFNNDVSSKIAELHLNNEFHFKLKTREFEINQEKVKNNYELKRQIWLRNTFIIGFLIMIILLLVNTYNFRQKKKANKALQMHFEQIKNQNIEIQHKTQLLEKTNQELEKLSIVASETDNGVMIMAPNGSFEWVNDGLIKIYGLSLDEVKETKGDNILKVSTNPDIEKIFKQCIAEKISMVYESYFDRNDGSRIWFQTTLTPILDSNKNIKKLVAIESNITKIKEFEEEILNKNEELETQKQEIIAQRDQILLQKKAITDSIKYAQKIQTAILPSSEYIATLFEDSFIFYRPKDIVSGDFYWFSEKNNEIIFGVVDCTGHGVPGAFMSLLGYNILKQAIIENDISSPDEILNFLNIELFYTMSTSGERDMVNDGMDIAICTLNRDNYLLSFAGCHNPLYHIRNCKLTKLSSDFHPIGTPFTKEFPRYSKSTIQLEKGDSIYIFSDGFSDQFSEKYGRKFLSKRLKESIIAHCHRPFSEQSQILNTIFEEWKGCVEQTDDVLVIGVKI